MPQLVKAGKYVFGWSQVSEEGWIRIPPEAFDEFELQGCNKVILMPGSKRSGGFGSTTAEKLKNSAIGGILAELPVSKGPRIYCWSNLSPDGCFSLPSDTLIVYGIEPG